MCDYSEAGLPKFSRASRLISKHFKYDSALNRRTKRYYAGTRLLATRTRRQYPLTDILSFVQPDHLGSTSQVADSTGTLQVRERYAAFGERRLGEEPKTTEYLYTGQRQHNLFGLYHYTDGSSAGRFYDPLLGRFVQPDPIRAGTGSQSFNPFSYVRNNPLRLVDPSGRMDRPGDDTAGGGAWGPGGGEGGGWPSGWTEPVGGEAVEGEGGLAEAIEQPIAGEADNPAVTTTELPAATAGEQPGVPGEGEVASPPSTQVGEEEYVDLTTPERRTHILEGDATGGGHRHGTSNPGKSEFPASWSDDKIMHEISDVATDPSSTRTVGRGGRTIVTGIRDGIEIRVVLEDPSGGGGIVTGYPTNSPRNP